MAGLTAFCFGLLSLTCAGSRILTDPLSRSDMPPAAPITPAQARIVSGAKAQIGNAYDASYCFCPIRTVIRLPGGDLHGCRRARPAGGRRRPSSAGSLRHDPALDRYPHKWGLSRPDPNIDHGAFPISPFSSARMENAAEPVTPQTLPAWQPGDIVCWKMPGGGDHIGLISDRRDLRGIPLVIHNLGRCEEQDVLTKLDDCGALSLPGVGTVETYIKRRGGRMNSRQQKHETCLRRLREN
ncbi:MAG: hypothetical protein FRX48_09195 [Lasallia pustulata]|uniref:DUF1287 domain-containing protein n=1 Tax=Lasallia pustulata TaxID=136370 RepID=A0A5M8PCT8_9LECA|nr:MAG: hypothetical protein FRX48_09195 [Lasallia pustulata]